MPKVSAPIVLDSTLWARIDALGARSGMTRDQVVDQAVGRLLGGQTLAALFDRVRGRSDLTEAEAEELVAAEKAALRDEGDAETSYHENSRG
jgi:hypothetical protein